MKTMQLLFGCGAVALVLMLLLSCGILFLALGYQMEVHNTLISMSDIPQEELVEESQDPLPESQPTVMPAPTKVPVLAKPAEAGKVAPTATPTKPLSETDPLVKIEIGGSGVSIVAEITPVQSYCFLPNGSKYVPKGEKQPHAWEKCPEGVKGDFRWDIPSSSKGIYRVGWQTGYPNDSPIILNGHKDGAGGDVFKNLQNLNVGDHLKVTAKSGRVFEYVMYDWKLFPLDSESLAWAINGVQTKDLSQNTLITYTCGGDLKNGQYLQRRVIYWKLVSSK